MIEEHEQDQDRLTGTIKFYKENEGYGFIASDDQDYYFRITSVIGESVPHAGDRCEFFVVEDRKGKGKGKNKKAEQITITKKNQNSDKNDNKIVCPGCGRKIVPRMSFYRGAPDKSFCPFCGAQIKDFGGCAGVFLLGIVGSISFLMFIVYNLCGK